MEDVALLETSNYNLFSVSKLVSSGWKINSDVSKVVMSKDSIVLTFDIAVKTTRGALFCTHFKRKKRLLPALTQS